MYTRFNFKTKKQLKEAVKRGEIVTIFQPGGIFHPTEDQSSYTGKAYVEGPHYPEAHKWYASVDVVEGKVVRVR